jgi:3'-phosphoadenosine 5'-phosphosulfate (PAPS) 3'-phosphatase
MSELTELKKFCKILADESGNVIKKYFRTGVAVESKNDKSPVTIADRQAEEVMKSSEKLIKKLNINGYLTRLTGLKVLSPGLLLSVH